ncbi:bifunctional protein-disulfide isomerase/oxidoreductase DsbC [Paraglaciecola sp. 2405UD69-4]|uniref:bifunctional protein-disulfide isomerase/oxidoreductase DsbC n=1 Tax=Paraglaciecola sp. 2405UD69-4 TaxID=3391836 RepID=UPI0039C8DD3F
MKARTKISSILAGLILSVSFSSSAADDTAKYEQAKAKIQNNLNMQVTSIGDAPIPGLLQVLTNRGLFYTSLDGQYLLQARIYDTEDGMRNLTEESLGQVRLDGIKAFENDTIEYKAENEKYVVNVFTDITCGYCRKLHNQMEEYNDLGITVRYLAFPRAGINSAPYNDMVSVWCSDNPQEAMNNAKAGASVTRKNCSTKVAQQYQFGQQIGVGGTPNIVLPNGAVIPGYQPPHELEKALKAIM